MSTFPKRLIEEDADSPARRLLENARTDAPPPSLVSAAILAASRPAAAPSGTRMRVASELRSRKVVAGVVVLVGALALFAAYQLADGAHGAHGSLVAAPAMSSSEIAAPALPPAAAPLAEERPVTDTPPRDDVPSASVAVSDLPNAPAASAPHRTPVVIAPSQEPRADKPVERSDLLREANRLRADGRWSEAAATYQRVLDLGPGSPESYPAEVALGNLDLQQGRGPSALSHYEHALLAHPAGALAEEARWGKARALRTMGRTAEERAALEELRDRHPDSPLVPVASRRLAEIGN
jgi:TolA-binding protein